ncbi:hypothetical protein ACFOU2_17645 [Bacillus songklensis]|uniref:Signal transduction histidine kinase 5TM receptor LytS transmembrane region domain-containing protein n=1 Tax=Bacillus songklensis TaxID=1069116 RepID=A0ABV8B7M6_9BACI
MNVLSGAVTLLFLWICLYMYRYRCFITKYTGMMIALASGMMIGFISAVSFGVAETVNHDDTSTILSLIISMLAGMIIGIPNSFAAWVLGACGGLISVPLGTTVVSLLTASKAESFMTALLFLCIGFTLFLLGMMTAEVPSYYDVMFRKIVQNALTIGLPLILIFYIYEMLDKRRSLRKTRAHSEIIEGITLDRRTK